jgi:hypothetical protein
MREHYKKVVFISKRLSPVLVSTLQAESFYHEQHFESNKNNVISTAKYLKK